jgi:hypothetical protein
MKKTRGLPFLGSGRDAGLHEKNGGLAFSGFWQAGALWNAAVRIFIIKGGLASPANPQPGRGFLVFMPGGRHGKLD